VAFVCPVLSLDIATCSPFDISFVTSFLSMSGFLSFISLFPFFHFWSLFLKSSSVSHFFRSSGGYLSLVKRSLSNAFFAALSGSSLPGFLLWLRTAEDCYSLPQVFWSFSPITFVVPGPNPLRLTSYCFSSTGFQGGLSYLDNVSILLMSICVSHMYSAVLINRGCGFLGRIAYSSSLFGLLKYGLIEWSVFVSIRIADFVLINFLRRFSVVQITKVRFVSFRLLSFRFISFRFVSNPEIE
jgi:hypothetical protein